jgi:hypothetical protein
MVEQGSCLREEGAREQERKRSVLQRKSGIGGKGTMTAASNTHAFEGEHSSSSGHGASLQALTTDTSSSGAGTHYSVTTSSSLQSLDESSASSASQSRGRNTGQKSVVQIKNASARRSSGADRRASGMVIEAKDGWEADSEDFAPPSEVKQCGWSGRVSRLDSHVRTMRASQAGGMAAWQRF